MIWAELLRICPSNWVNKIVAAEVLLECVSHWLLQSRDKCDANLILTALAWVNDVLDFNRIREVAKILPRLISEDLHGSFVWWSLRWNCKWSAHGFISARVILSISHTRYLLDQEIVQSSASLTLFSRRIGSSSGVYGHLQWWKLDGHGISFGLVDRGAALGLRKRLVPAGRRRLQL